jgi:N-acetyl-alpha-D-muramate 1-phosphate uridylyltransferase
MKAMIFAAGLGTRLKPITDHMPKALVEVNGITLLEHTIRKLQDFGIREILVNVHHFSEQIISFLKNKNNFGIRIEISDESGQLLDTGGGLKKAEWFFHDNEAVLLHNVDVISDIDLESLCQSHVQSNALATLAVRHRDTSRYFLFNDDSRLCGWENRKTGEKKLTASFTSAVVPLAFSGIQVISRPFLDLISESGKFSMTDVYLRLSAYHPIFGYIHDYGNWIDLGKAESLAEAEDILRRNTNSY